MPSNGGHIVNIDPALFASIYLKCFNAEETCRELGYTKKEARSNAHIIVNREDVQDAIQKEAAKIIQKSNVQAARVLKRMWDIVNVDIADVYEDDGYTLKSLKKIPVEARRAITCIKSNRHGQAIMMDSKIKALEHLGKVYGLAMNDIAVNTMNIVGQATQVNVVFSEDEKNDGGGE